MVEPAADAEAAAARPVEVIDETPIRIRRPLDVLRLGGLVVVLLLAGALGTVASDTARAANQDLTRLLGQIPHVLIHSLSLLGALAALALTFGLVIREIVRGQARRLIEGLGTGLLAIAVVDALDLAISAHPSSALHSSLTQVSQGTTARPLDAYLAALFALALVIGVEGEPGWRAAFWSVTAFYIVSASVAAQASLLSLIASPVIGAAAGVGVRYIAGGANERPDAHRVAEELARRGIALARLERRTSPRELHRSYLATGVTGGQFTVQVFDRDLIASGVAYGIYRRLRIRAAVAAPPALSLERIAERRSVLAYAAMAADVRIPRFIAGVPCGSDTIVLVYEAIPGTPMLDPSDEQLTDLWRNVEKLHHARTTHRGLTADRILIDAHGAVVLPIPTDGAVFASDLRISLDRAQALITTAQLVGAERAVQLARTILTDDGLAATMPLLQPIALTRETRTALRRDAELLDSVRDQIHGQTHFDAVAATRVERFRPRVVVSFVAVLVAAYLILGQLGSVDLVTAFSATRWRWVPLVALASVGTYLAAGLALTGYVKEKLQFTRTVLVQVAASFVGFVTPPSVGGLAINIRYLRAARLSPTAAATSVGMSQVINAVSHVVLLIIFATATGVSSDKSLPIPGWAFVAVGALAVLVMLVLAVPSPRRWVLARVLPTVREVIPRLLDLASSPRKLSEVLSGVLLLNGFYIGALWFSVRAFDGRLDIAAVAVVYLAGAAVASAAPTPGGLGAVEITLSTGLAAASMPSAAAVSAVLLFRIATFWLPVPAGWVALQLLQRRGAL